jgi:hypothetical protein
MAVKSSKPKTSKKQKLEKKSSPPKKRKSVTSKTNTNNVRTTQQGLVNQAAKTGNQTTVIRINNALAKASARLHRRYAGIPKPPIQYAQPSIGIAPACNIQFPPMGANYDNDMREVNGMRDDIINEFRRLNPNAAYVPPPPPAPPGAGAVAAVPPPPMSEHPDVVYDEPGGVADSAAMSIELPAAPSVHTEPVAEAMDIDNEIPVPAVPEAPPIPQAPQDPLHVGGNPAIPVAQGQIPEAQYYVDLGDADEPLVEQLFPNMVDGATATETSSKGTIRTQPVTTRSRGTSTVDSVFFFFFLTVDFDNAVRPLELEFQQPAIAPQVTPRREGTPEPVVTEPPDEILSAEQRNPRGPEELIPDPPQIEHRNQEEEDDRQIARRPQAWQEYAEQAHLDRGLAPERPPPMHLADMAAAMEYGTQRTRRGINNRPGINRPGSLVPAPQTEPPMFDQTNQQNMLEHMDTPSQGATSTIPGFPKIPADLESFNLDFSSFPDYPGFLNDGPPTSPAPPFIEDYLNAPTSPQGLLGFEEPVVPEPPAPATS